MMLLTILTQIINRVGQKIDKVYWSIILQLLVVRIKQFAPKCSAKITVCRSMQTCCQWV